MPDQGTQKAESSTEVEVEEKEYEAPDPEAFTPEQREKWLQTGETPKPKKTEEAAASEISEEKPESGAGKTEPVKETEKKPTQNAETRAAQLEAEIAEMKRQKAERIQALLNERRQLKEELSKSAETPKSESQPEPKAATERPKRPKFDDFDGDYDKYEQALDQYEEKLADWKFAARLETERQKFIKDQQKQAIEKHNATVRQTWDKGVAESKSHHDDFDEVVRSLDLPLNQLMDQYLLNSEQGPEMLYRLCKDPKEAERISKLPGFACLDALAEMKLKISEESKGSLPKTLTSAKPPGTQLSGVNRGAEDEAEAALETGDTERYMEIMNRRDAARILGK
jgi:hypothetical protein